MLPSFAGVLTLLVCLLLLLLPLVCSFARIPQLRSEYDAEGQLVFR
jgi:hypothetical protein